MPHCKIQLYVGHASTAIMPIYLFLATIEETACPVGTIRETAGGASVDDCLPCPAGDYCLEGSFETSGGCESGYYCPSPILNPYGNSPAEIGSYGPRQVRVFRSLTLSVHLITDLLLH